jgi:hypothetical protein
LRSISPLLSVLGVAAASIVAYFVREYRLGHSKLRDGPRHVERSPVMPRHIPGDDQ